MTAQQDVREEAVPHSSQQLNLNMSYFRVEGAVDDVLAALIGKL